MQESPRANSSVYVRFAIICFGYLFALVPRFALAVNADRIASDFNLLPSALGILASAYFWTYATTQAPSGIIADKLAPEILIMISLAGITFSNLLFASAKSFNLAIVSRLITGLTGSLIYVPALRFTASNFSSNFSFMSGILGSLNGICVIMVNGPLVGLSENYGWRSIFLLSAGVCIVSAVVLFLLHRHHSNNGGSPKKTTEPTKHIGDFGFKEVVKNKLAWPMFLRIFLSYGVGTSFQSLWAGPYMMGILGMTRAATGRTLALMSMPSLITAPLGGYLADNVIKTRRLMNSTGLVFSALSWLPLVFFVDSLTPTTLTIILCSTHFLAGIAGGSSLAQVKEVYPPEAVGAAMGVHNTFLILGGAVLPALFGFIIGSTTTITAAQFKNAFLLNFVFMAIAAIASFSSVETYGKSYEEIILGSRRAPKISSQA